MSPISEDSELPLPPNLPTIRRDDAFAFSSPPAAVDLYVSDDGNGNDNDRDVNYDDVGREAANVDEGGILQAMNDNGNSNAKDYANEREMDGSTLELEEHARRAMLSLLYKKMEDWRDSMLMSCGDGQDYDDIHINGGGGGVKGNEVRGEAALARAGPGALESLALYDAKAVTC